MSGYNGYGNGPHDAVNDPHAQAQQYPPQQGFAQQQPGFAQTSAPYEHTAYAHNPYDTGQQAGNQFSPGQPEYGANQFAQPSYGLDAYGQAGYANPANVVPPDRRKLWWGLGIGAGALAVVVLGIVVLAIFVNSPAQKLNAARDSFVKDFVSGNDNAALDDLHPSLRKSGQDSVFQQLRSTYKIDASCTPEWTETQNQRVNIRGLGQGIAAAVSVGNLKCKDRTVPVSIALISDGEPYVVNLKFS